MEQSIQLPEVQEICGLVRNLAQQIEDLRQKMLPGKLWYSRAELAELKGMIVSVFYNKPWLLPPGEPSKQGGNDRWSYNQVWESGWIWKSDADLNPRGGEDGDGTRTGVVTPLHGSVRRVQRSRQGALSGQPG